MAGLEGTKTDRQALTGDISVKPGIDGKSVTIVKITESTEDGGNNIVEFSDGSRLKIKNGSGGKIGIDGKSAYQYAQDGGYTGTEEEFALLMSQENLQTEKVDKISIEVSKLSEEKVSNPSTGEVGQILEIETVDEKGKPKTYKAVNKPTGGEVSDEQIAEAVENYLTENPIEGGGGADGEDGVGIQSVEQTTTSIEDGGTNIITVTKTDGTSSTFQVLNGSKGSQGEKGEKGEQGATGEKGETGEKGDKGDTGEQGADGKTAYQYAQDGGYTGTEEEFAQKLAQENIQLAKNLTTTEEGFALDATQGKILQDAIDEQNKNMIGFPDYRNAIEVDNEYTALENGFISVCALSGDTSTEDKTVEIRINGYLVYQDQYGLNASTWWNRYPAFIPIKKGDVVVSATWKCTVKLYFLPCRY